MAKAWITEFPLNRANSPGVVKSPPIAEQTVTYTSNAQSAAFNANTDVVRVVADADAFLAFGSNPTATANSMKLPSGNVEYIAVNPGDKVAFYDGTT